MFAEAGAGGPCCSSTARRFSSCTSCKVTKWMEDGFVGRFGFFGAGTGSLAASGSGRPATGGDFAIAFGDGSRSLEVTGAG